MKIIQIVALVVIAAFYVAYFTEMILQRRKGVKTDQMGRGSKPKKVIVIEILMKIATFSVVAAEVISVIFDFAMWKSSYAFIGIGIALAGVVVFIVAMVTMRDSWRAGIPSEDETELVTSGIYRISRNPAFLGFDLVYAGILVAFFNYFHLFFVLYAVIMLHLQILQEEKFLAGRFGDRYVEYKKRTGRYFIFDKDYSKKTKIIIAAVVVLCVAAIVAGVAVYGSKQTSKLPDLNFREALEYTTKNNPDAVITVGVIKNGESSYTVYGNDGKELSKSLHTYEIGSLTKTFTAALISKAIEERKVSLGDTIDKYLSLPKGKNYPMIEGLLTHTSGYKGYYFEAPMIVNFLVGRNDFYGITKKEVLLRAGKLDMPEKSYGFEYSNYGFAVLGLVLESVYGTEYESLLNDFAAGELGLKNTKISDGNGDLGNYWNWKSGDAYLSAGAITSDIEDMLEYAKMQLSGERYFARCHDKLAEINGTPQSYKTLGINMDEIGMAWIIDSRNGFVWHNGGTGNYNSYLGFDKESSTAVVVLSNTAPGYRIPATVVGVKLLNELA